MILRCKFLAVPLMTLAFLAAGSSAKAQTFFLQATLSNGQENPPTVPTLVNGTTPRPASFGTATFVLNVNANPSLSFMTFTTTIFNIDFTGSQTADTNDNLGNAHLHASATVTPTTNAPVVWGFFGSPLNDNTPNDVVVTPFTSGVGGTISGKWDAPEGNGTTLAAQIPNLLSNHAYINFHTSQFAGGEIRGNIIVAPEPGTLALLAITVLPVAGVAVRRRHSA